jgi:hypothetical protein
MNFRAIQWQPALVWPWAHSMRPNAMLLADVDGDDNCELVVGSVTGELAAFKFDQLVPWKSYSSLGSITCFAMTATMAPRPKPVLIAVAAEGWCSLLLLADDCPDPLLARYSIPFNVTSVLLADLDKDGQDELILGSDDHHVYAYELPLADLVRVDLPRPMELYDQMLALVLKRTWKMPQEVQSLCVHTHSDQPIVIVGLPDHAGAYATISWHDGIELSPTVTSSEPEGEQRGSAFGAVESSLGSDMLDTGASIVCVCTSMQSSLATLHAAPIRHKPRHDEAAGESARLCPKWALCTEEGVLAIFSETCKRRLIPLEPQLFALGWVDLSDNGKAELLACATSGKTYIIDDELNVVVFDFGRITTAFASGWYSLFETDRRRAIVYASGGYLWLYTQISLPFIAQQTLRSDVPSTNPAADLSVNISQDSDAQFSLDMSL